MKKDEKNKKRVSKKVAKRAKASGKKPIAKVKRAKTAVQPLSDKQEIFCHQYCIDRNATQAYIRTYGVGQKTAEVNGCRLLSNAKIKSRIDELMVKVAEEIDIDVKRVLQEYARIAFSDIGECIGDGNTIKEIGELPAHVRAAIKKIRHSPVGSEVELQPKLPALNDLARHLGMFEADNKQRVPDAIQQVYDIMSKESYKRPCDL